RMRTSSPNAWTCCAAPAWDRTGPAAPTEEKKRFAHLAAAYLLGRQRGCRSGPQFVCRQVILEGDLSLAGEGATVLLRQGTQPIHQSLGKTKTHRLPLVPIGVLFRSSHSLIVR